MVSQSFESETKDLSIRRTRKKNLTKYCDNSHGRNERIKQAKGTKKVKAKPRLVGVNKKLAWIYRNDLVASLELVVSHVRGQRKMDANWMEHARSLFIYLKKNKKNEERKSSSSSHFAMV